MPGHRVSTRMESHLSLPCSFFGRVEILVHLIVTLFDLRLIRLLPSSLNAQLPSFNSKFTSPGFSGVDVLVQDWNSENNWICPPVSLSVDSVRHLTSCVARGTLIYSEWPSSYFWPFLGQGCRFKPFVVEAFALTAIGNLLPEGPGQRQIYKFRASAFRGCPNSEC